jgi:predicted deacylase
MATIAASIDLDAPGKRIGHLELAWSDDEHAYGIIPVPIAVVANGNGPSVLVTAGVHGDEYEGLVITRKLIAELLPEAISGRIVIMPGLNWPAVRARRRVSPIDDLARPPVAIRFAVGGIVLARRTMPMVVRGDYVCHVGEPMSDDNFRGGT